MHWYLVHIKPKQDKVRIAESSATGISMLPPDCINYCFRALVEKGWIKMQNFSHSKHKLRYAPIILLTPAGISERSKLMAEFLKRKLPTKLSSSARKWKMTCLVI